ncbi:MAG: hypothetical protein ACJLUP_12175 [Agrobacterium tumefaciens]
MVSPKLIFLARNNADEAVKQRLMRIMRDLIQTVVIGKTPGHQPANVQVHDDIAHIMASMDAIDVLQQQFFAAAQNDLMTLMASGELSTEVKSKSSSRFTLRSLNANWRSAGVWKFLVAGA